MIEPLEPRIAPALVFPNGKGFTYTDLDGDFVTVKFSKAVVATPAIRDAVTIFAGGPNWGQNTMPENLLTLDFTKAGSAALIAGLDVTITAKQRGTGDGYVHLFGIAARSDAPVVNDVFGDLGKVKVDGWLNFFTAGDAIQAPKTQAVKSLEVQGLGDQFENLPVQIVGSLGSLIVKGNVTSDISIRPPAGFGFDDVTIGKIWIGGSLIAGAQGDGGTLDLVAKTTGSLYIGGNVQGGVAADSGAVNAERTIKSVTIRGSILGGNGSESGVVRVTSPNVKVGGSLINRVESVFSVAGNVFRAGGSIHVAPLMTSGSIDSITVGGTLRGGNIVANVLAGVDGFFGTADDVREQPLLTIGLGKVVVKGGVEQVNTPGFFGVVANDLKTVQLGRLTLTDAANYAAGISIGAFVRVREI